MLTISLGLCLVISVVTQMQGGIALNDQTNRDYLIWENERVIQWDMINIAVDAYDEENQNEEVPLRS